MVWAAWRCGVYVTPMSTALTATELRYLIEDCDARLVLVDAGLHAQAVPLSTLVSTGPQWLSPAAGRRSAISGMRMPRATSTSPTARTT